MSQPRPFHPNALQKVLWPPDSTHSPTGEITQNRIFLAGGKEKTQKGMQHNTSPTCQLGKGITTLFSG